MYHQLVGTSVLCSRQLHLLLNPSVRGSVCHTGTARLFVFSLGHCCSPIPECAVRNGTIFLKSLEVKLPSCLHLTCATRWHFKNITGN